MLNKLMVKVYYLYSKVYFYNLLLFYFYIRILFIIPIYSFLFSYFCFKTPSFLLLILLIFLFKNFMFFTWIRTCPESCLLSYVVVGFFYHHRHHQMLLTPVTNSNNNNILSIVMLTFNLLLIFSRTLLFVFISGMVNMVFQNFLLFFL